MKLIDDLPDRVHKIECGNLKDFPTLDELRQLIREVNELREENEDLGREVYDLSNHLK
jgi:hypothetical protein